MSHTNAITMSRRMRAWTLVLGVLAALVASAGAAAQAHAAPAAADWTAASANTAGGTLLGTSVSLSGSDVSDTGHGSVLDGTAWYFAGPAFSPALPKSDAIHIGNAPGHSFTIRLGRPITDPILELGSLGSPIDFPGIPVTKVSGESGFTVQGSRVSGTPTNTFGTSNHQDASGTIKLIGTYSTITLRAPNYVGPNDGIYVQVCG